MRYIDKRLKEIQRERVYYSRSRKSGQNRASYWRRKLDRAGLTPKTYDARLIAQRHQCALCDARIASGAPDPARQGRGPGRGTARIWIAPGGVVLLCAVCIGLVSVLDGRPGTLDRLVNLCTK